MFDNCSFLGEIPWGKFDTDAVRYKILQAREQLEVESDKIPEVFQIILQYGLQLDPLHRKLQMLNIKNLLTIPKQVKINIFWSVVVRQIVIFMQIR